jgi:enolase
LAENVWMGWANMARTLGKKIDIVGDDLFCTNKAILTEGIQKGVANMALQLVLFIKNSVTCHTFHFLFKIFLV